MKHCRSLLQRLSLVAFLSFQCFARVSRAEPAPFLTLPYADSKIVVTTGWLYDAVPEYPSDHPEYGPVFEFRGHRGIDFALPPANEFDVLAAASGQAIAVKTPDYGYIVYIKHDAIDDSGKRFFTLYAHLKKDSWKEPEVPISIPTETLVQMQSDIKSELFTAWQSIGRGQKIGVAGASGHAAGIHLHFEVQRGGWRGPGIDSHKTDPYNIYGLAASYPVPYVRAGLLPDTLFDYPSALWTTSPPTSPLLSTEVQPGPADGKDIWTTSYYSYASGPGPGPGGGLYDSELRVGGWADLYYSLLQFDLTGLPAHASSATLQLYCYSSNYGSPTPMYLERITQFWWDWQSSGHGYDHDRLWWADKPPTLQWSPGTIPAPVVGQWYSIDITDLYNKWQSGEYTNFGVELQPQLNWNNFNFFYSSRYTGDPTLRPKIVVVP